MAAIRQADGSYVSDITGRVIAPAGTDPSVILNWYGQDPNKPINVNTHGSYSTENPIPEEEDVGDLSLERYTGKTKVSLSPYERNIMDLVNSLVTGQYGNYRQMLSGTPDYGLMNQGVIEPMREQFRTQTLPQIRDAYSGGAYGGDYNTGARQAAEEDAAFKLTQSIAGLRYQAQNDAATRSLQAMAQLPGLEGIQATERLNDIANLERTMQVHYQNQGLTVQEYQADLESAKLALSEALGYGQLDLAKQELALKQQMYRDSQSDSGLGGLLGGVGSLVGAGLGSMFGPGGIMIGSSLGGSLGMFAGGANNAGYQNLSSGIQNYAGMSILNNMMPNLGIFGNPSMNMTPSSSLLQQTMSYTPAYMTPMQFTPYGDSSLTSFNPMSTF